MTAIFIERVLALVVLTQGWEMSQDHPAWKVVVGIIVFILGVEWFSQASVRAYQRKKMPYRWTCNRCNGKVGVEASRKDVMISFRDDHNRRVHLEEA